MNVWYELGSLVPSIGVGFLFWFVMRAILRADRREREALREAERADDAARRGAVGGTSGRAPTGDAASRIRP